MTARLIQLINIGCSQLGIDRDTRHDMQRQLTGKSSLKEMSEAELELVIDNLKQKGFTPKGGKRPRHDNGTIRTIHVLWRKLYEAGAVDRKGRAGLNVFMRTRFEQSWGALPLDVDQLTNQVQIDDLFQALVAMGKRHERKTGQSIGFDWGRIGK